MERGGRALPRRVVTVAGAGDRGEDARRRGAGGADAVECGDGGSDDAEDLSESDESEVDLGPPSFSVFKRLLMSMHCFRTSQGGTPAPGTHTSAHLFACRAGCCNIKGDTRCVRNGSYKKRQAGKGRAGGGGVRKGNVSRIAVFLKSPTTHARSSTCMWGTGAWNVRGRRRGRKRDRKWVCWGQGMTGADEK